jgi:hypothetical protein
MAPCLSRDCSVDYRIVFYYGGIKAIELTITHSPIEQSSASAPLSSILWCLTLNLRRRLERSGIAVRLNTLYGMLPPDIYLDNRHCLCA